MYWAFATQSTLTAHDLLSSRSVVLFFTDSQRGMHPRGQVIDDVGENEIKIRGESWGI